MIPSKTGAAEAVGLVLPELAGKLTGMAVRVPVINVSLVDLTVNLKREASAEEVNQLFLEASRHSRILGYNALPLVSCDFNHNPLSSIFDANHTRANGRMLKVMAWYDNEWGFSTACSTTAWRCATRVDLADHRTLRQRLVGSFVGPGEACDGSQHRATYPLFTSMRLDQTTR